MTKLAVNQLSKDELEGKKVFVRVDFNAPMANGVISDDSRLQQALPTIQYLQESGAKIILASFLNFSLSSISFLISKIILFKVSFTF